MVTLSQQFFIINIFTFLTILSHPLKLELNNLLVKTFKQANPNLTHEKAQKRVKEYYDMIKNKLFI